jgi:thymidylate synthase
LNSRGLHHYQEDELGAIYGRQWRHFNAECDEFGKRNEYSHGVDQLQQIIDALKDPKQRTSRRLVMSAWNPCQLDQMALPPCHILCQFNVHDGNKLSCSMYQRSNDECCGTPFNIASYSFLTHLLAKHCGLEAYEFVYFKGNCHIYEEHIEIIKEQLKREPYPFPTLTINQVRDNINDYQIEDFIINNYFSHEPIKFRMVA